MRITAIICLFIILSETAIAQVDDIKKASESHKDKSETKESSGASDILIIDLIQFSFRGLAEWQQVKLQKREAIPDMVSLEIIGQAASRPATYYIINPRIRGTWGLFSTDFRINYLIEEDIDGIKHIRTNDWQVLELNIVTHKNVNWYVGTGFLYEAFNDGAYYPEFTTALKLRKPLFPVSINAEYRYSEPRIEVNANAQVELLSIGSMHTYVTGGLVFQQYYSSIKVWGMQGGVVLKLY
jgi:hypothetical protein